MISKLRDKWDFIVINVCVIVRLSLGGSLIVNIFNLYVIINKG